MKNQYLSEIEEKLNTPINIETKIDSLLQYFKELNFQKPQLLKLCIDFTAQALWVPVFADQLKDLYEKIIVIIEKNVLLEGADENHNSSSPKVLARFIFGALFGISVQVQLGLDEKYSDQSLDIVMKLPFLMN